MGNRIYAINPFGQIREVIVKDGYNSCFNCKRLKQLDGKYVCDGNYCKNKKYFPYDSTKCKNYIKED